MDNNKVKVVNPHLADIGEDHFHHFGFNTSGTDVKKEYSDVKVGVINSCHLICKQALSRMLSSPGDFSLLHFSVAVAPLNQSFHAKM